MGTAPPWIADGRRADDVEIDVHQCGGARDSSGGE